MKCSTAGDSARGHSGDCLRVCRSHEYASPSWPRWRGSVRTTSCRSSGTTFGTTPHRYLLQQRIEAAKQLLRRTGGSISEIGLDLGFADQCHFTRTFRRLTGTTPQRFKLGGGARSR